MVHCKRREIHLSLVKSQNDMHEAEQKTSNTYSVGAGDGSSVGKGDGLSVGEGDGLSVGEVDGSSVGEGDGLSVGGAVTVIAGTGS